MERATLADALDISVEGLAKYERGDTRPHSDVLEYYRSAHGVDVNWLLTGKGAMFSDPEKNSLSGSVVAIPSYDIQPAAGSGSALHVEAPDGYIVLTEAIVASFGVDRSSLSMLVCKGDSMYPTIGDGDLMVITTQFDLQTVLLGGVFIFSDWLGVRVKQMAGTMDGQIRVTSHNVNYRDELIEPDRIGDDIFILGEVVWSGGTLRVR